MCFVFFIFCSEETFKVQLLFGGDNCSLTPISYIGYEFSDNFQHFLYLQQENILDLCNKIEETCTSKYFPFNDLLHCAQYMSRLPKTSPVCPYFQGNNLLLTKKTFKLAGGGGGIFL